MRWFNGEGINGGSGLPLPPQPSPPPAPNTREWRSVHADCPQAKRTRERNGARPRTRLVACVRTTFAVIREDTAALKTRNEQARVRPSHVRGGQRRPRPSPTRLRAPDRAAEAAADTPTSLHGCNDPGRADPCAPAHLVDRLEQRNARAQWTRHERQGRAERVFSGLCRWQGRA
jgi:hypothetical protein